MAEPAGHDARLRALGFNDRVVTHKQADVMPISVLHKKDRRAGAKKRVCGQLALLAAVLIPYGVGAMVDGPAQLPKRPGEQAAAVSDPFADPAAAVAHRHGAGGGALLFMRPYPTRLSPDVAPALTQGLTELAHQRRCFNHVYHLPVQDAQQTAAPCRAAVSARL
ncbi:MAG TPA: hypothetical protein GXZ86_06765 [Clostridiales bacterium]|nr:hypothetical protein [Clostridiales bacterium]